MDIKKEDHTAETKEVPIKTEPPSKKEEGTSDVATDSEDIKLEHQTANAIGEVDKDDDDDMLTSMSLNEDLEIFDGLQFEDGGGIIDMSFHTLGRPGEDNDSGEHAMGDADDTDAPAQDEDETIDDDHVVDDDDDDNEDTSNRAADGETTQQETQAVTLIEDTVDTASTHDVLTDF
eukprot:jgi/Phyca11/508273/fgenesh2_kg.PHYCAscaffold_33_\